jgi:PPOX class probable F420-dependent enzyme
VYRRTGPGLDSILRGSRRLRVERRLIAPSGAAYSAALDRRRFRDMALKHRLADVSYWFYDRARHKTAFESAVEPGTASDFAGLKGHKYALLVTFRRDGTAVPTPVWFALLADRRLVTSSEARTAKVRRIRRDPRARVFPCDPRGKPLGPGVEGTARILEDAQDCERAEAALDRHYGRTRRIYEKLMAPKEGMVYLEIASAAQLTDRPSN